MKLYPRLAFSGLYAATSLKLRESNETTVQTDCKKVKAALLSMHAASHDVPGFVCPVDMSVMSEGAVPRSN